MAESSLLRTYPAANAFLCEFQLFYLCIHRNLESAGVIYTCIYVRETQQKEGWYGKAI